MLIADELSLLLGKANVSDWKRRRGAVARSVFVAIERNDIVVDEHRDGDDDDEETLVG